MRPYCVLPPPLYVFPFHHPNNSLQFQFLAPYYIAAEPIATELRRADVLTHRAILSQKCMSKHKIEVARYAIKANSR